MGAMLAFILFLILAAMFLVIGYFMDKREAEKYRKKSTYKPRVYTVEED